MDGKQVGRGPRRGRARLLIVGAGEAGRSLVLQIRAEKLPYQPVGFLDDDTELAGRRICGLPVLGRTDELVEAARRVDADEILIAIPSSPGSLVRRLVPLCKRADLPFKIVPGLRAIIEGDVSFEQVRSVAPEDLLGRETVTFRAGSAREVVQDRTVLVTGAGGSIGGELCRQLLTLRPRELILLGRGENSIFEITTELASTGTATGLRPVIADIRDRERLLRLARKHRPDLLLHAAAHKHVPFMEVYPEEAAVVNVGGTAHLIEFAREAAVDRFVLISTDKAVEPTNVMGATKKVAELLVREAQDNGSRTRFMNVRFGNVLGSRGSVVPYFQRRIAAGLPLPITDSRMTRYFMTIKEAALLVIEAMVLGEAGTTYILEMGEPVPILELARNLLALSGYDLEGGGGASPGIVVTGLRPGERLHESLVAGDEVTEPSANPLICKARPATPGATGVAASVARLLDLASRGDRAGVRELLAELAQSPGLNRTPAADDSLHVLGPEADLAAPDSAPSP
jgi:FlaA1/EpsC-like NDP-sugar epimerase